MLNVRECSDGRYRGPFLVIHPAIIFGYSLDDEMAIGVNWMDIQSAISLEAACHVLRGIASVGNTRFISLLVYGLVWIIDEYGIF